MWKAHRCTHPAVWERVMLTIKELNIHAYKYLITIPLQSNYEMTSISCFPRKSELKKDEDEEISLIAKFPLN